MPVRSSYVGAACVLLALAASSARADEAAPASAAHTHMPETVRNSIGSLAVVGGPDPGEEEITGTYEEVTPGLYGGVAQGSRFGTPSAQIGMVTVSFPIPILTVPGAIIGGLAGKAKQDLQRLRDAMAEDIAKADNQPLTNDGLALDVFWNLQRLPAPASRLFAPGVPIPDETDAVLYVSVSKLLIDVEEDEAILTATGELTLRKSSDDSVLYRRLVEYQDRDSLAGWTDNDNALWRDYANFARHYLSRELAAEAFDRVEPGEELLPVGTATAKVARRNTWQFDSKSASPTLAWRLELSGVDDYGPWASALDESAIDYDVEIYDRHRLVYSQKQVPDPSHTLTSALEPCRTYWWSVRPVYRTPAGTRFGNWMRQAVKPGKYAVDGLTGRHASEAPAYVQDFATLAIGCGAR